MIDASRSPRPAWKRYGTFLLLVAVIAVAAVVIWKKELHHNSPASAPQVPAAVVPAHPAAHTAKAAKPAKPASPTTTVPGGLPISTRNPFKV
jgi:hypothetical protein